MHTIQELDRRRKELGLTHAALSARSGVSVPTLQKIFSGTTASPRFSTIKKLEAVLFTELAPATGSEGSGSPVSSYTGAGKAWEPYPSGGYDANPAIICEPPTPYRAGDASPDDAMSGEPTERTLSVYDPNDWVRRLGKPQGTFTVEDVEKIPEDQHYELIDGVLIRLESPTFEHQQILVYMMTEFYRFIMEEDCDCVVVCAPFDIQLDRDHKTRVEPDILIICNEENVTPTRGDGAPDLCVEILSPSTRSKDQLLQRYKYEKAGVKEFWVVDPEYRRITVYLLEQEGEPKTYTFEDTVPIGLCGGKHAIDFSKCRIGFRRRS